MENDRKFHKLKKLLNENGLNKLLNYLEQCAPGIRNVITINGNKLLIDDIEISVHVPINENQWDSINDIASMAQPTIIDKEPIGKGAHNSPNPVKRIGRAAAKKAEVAKQETAEIAKQEAEAEKDEQDEMQTQISDLASKIKQQ